MGQLFLYLILNLGMSVGDALSVINLYGRLKNNTSYRLGDNFVSNYKDNLATNASTNHAEFLDYLNDLQNILLSDRNQVIR